MGPCPKKPGHRGAWRRVRLDQRRSTGLPRICSAHLHTHPTSHRNPHPPHLTPCRRLREPVHVQFVSLNTPATPYHTHTPKPHTPNTPTPRHPHTLTPHLPPALYKCALHIHIQIHLHIHTYTYMHASLRTCVHTQSLFRANSHKRTCLDAYYPACADAYTHAYRHT